MQSDKYFFLYLKHIHFPFWDNYSQKENRNLKKNKLQP